MASAASASTGNRLLDALLRECRPLRQSIEDLNVPVGATLAREGEPATHVYFPASGVLSTVIQLAGGGSSEVFIVGSEGMIGVAVWLGVKTHLANVVQQAPGVTLRIPSTQFCGALEHAPRATSLLKRFIAYSLRLAYQTTVCNATHTVEQRACRWLLSTAERAGSPHIQMSQALLAEILGVRRQSVGEVAVRLQEAGALRYARTRIEIVDREKLEAASCECYGHMSALYEKLLASR